MNHQLNMPSNSNLRVIIVTGNGEINVAPNIAELRIEVVTEGMDIQEAQKTNTASMNQIIQALLQLNINREDIQTAAFNIFPRYDYVEGRQVFRGYEVTNALTVKVRNINNIGRVIDEAVKNGANRISSIEFKLDNEYQFYHQALQIALLNAISKARTIANTLQLHYSPQPIEITEESVEVPPILYRAAALSQDSFETPIEQGLISVKAEVRVKFQY
nr:SIMPL domain-containing protein [Lysinibacillus timonensis]